MINRQLRIDPSALELLDVGINVYSPNDVALRALEQELYESPEATPRAFDIYYSAVAAWFATTYARRVEADGG
ncbi:MAG: hypothetical protein DDT36_01270 [Firmicutes bacterium]|nr:hypothetical protein [Bacillota bacterium]